MNECDAFVSGDKKVTRFKAPSLRGTHRVVVVRFHDIILGKGSALLAVTSSLSREELPLLLLRTDHQRHLLAANTPPFQTSSPLQCR